MELEEKLNEAYGYVDQAMDRFEDLAEYQKEELFPYLKKAVDCGRLLFLDSMEYTPFKGNYGQHKSDNVKSHLRHFSINLRGLADEMINQGIGRKKLLSYAMYKISKEIEDVPSSGLYINPNKLDKILRSEVNRFITSNRNKYKKHKV